MARRRWKERSWWDRLSDEAMRLVYGLRDPRAARIHANRSGGARRGWETRRARARLGTSFAYLAEDEVTTNGARHPETNVERPEP